MSQSGGGKLVVVEKAVELLKAMAVSRSLPNRHEKLLNALQPACKVVVVSSPRHIISIAGRNSDERLKLSTRETISASEQDIDMEQFLKIAQQEASCRSGGRLLIAPPEMVKRITEVASEWLACGSVATRTKRSLLSQYYRQCLTTGKLDTKRLVQELLDCGHISLQKATQKLSYDVLEQVADQITVQFNQSYSTFKKIFSSQEDVSTSVDDQGIDQVVHDRQMEVFCSSVEQAPPVTPLHIVVLQFIINMGSSRPQTIPKLVNALQPVCKVSFAMSPVELLHQCGVRRIVGYSTSTVDITSLCQSSEIVHGPDEDRFQIGRKRTRKSSQKIIQHRGQTQKRRAKPSLLTHITFNGMWKHIESMCRRNSAVPIMTTPEEDSITVKQFQNLLHSFSKYQLPPTNPQESSVKLSSSQHPLSLQELLSKIYQLCCRFRQLDPQDVAQLLSKSGVISATHDGSVQYHLDMDSSIHPLSPLDQFKTMLQCDFPPDSEADTLKTERATEIGSDWATKRRTRGHSHPIQRSRGRRGRAKKFCF